MNPSALPPTIQTAPPGRVQAALQFVGMMLDKERGGSAFDVGQRTPGDLSKCEAKTRDAALEMLRLYFAGEMNFGDAAVTPNAPPDDPGERERVSV